LRHGLDARESLPPDSIRDEGGGLNSLNDLSVLNPFVWLIR
jgi:hypothetical protein